MNRRSILASAAAVSLPGCSSFERFRGGENHTRDGDGSPSSVTGVPRDDVRRADEVEVDPPGEGFPALDVSTDGTADSLGIEFLVGVVNSYTEADPASVQIDLVNRSDEARQIKFGAVPPFSALWAESSPGESDLYIVPTDRSRVTIRYPDQLESDDAVDGGAPIDGCWMVEDVLRQDIMRDGVVQPGHVVSETYDVFGDASAEACLEPGEYRFSESLTLESLEEPLELGVTITVEE